MKLLGKALLSGFKGVFFMFLLVGFLAISLKGLYDELDGNVPNGEGELV